MKTGQLQMTGSSSTFFIAQQNVFKLRMESSSPPKNMAEINV